MQPLERSTPEFVECLTAAIVALSRHFCGVVDALPKPGEKVNGRDKLDPVYVAVTEHRDGPGPEQRKYYSSCGDQLHAILERIGVRNEPWVNRKALGHYTNGANITRLHGGACPPAKYAPRVIDYRPPVGSLCLMWNTGLDAHAFTILGPGSDDRHILTGNYGAGGMCAATAPGANVADSPILWDGRALRFGQSRRILQSVITPASLVPYITAQIDLSGAPVSGELVDALGARYE